MGWSDAGRAGGIVVQLRVRHNGAACRKHAGLQVRKELIRPSHIPSASVADRLALMRAAPWCRLCLRVTEVRVARRDSVSTAWLQTGVRKAGSRAAALLQRFFGRIPSRMSGPPRGLASSLLHVLRISCAEATSLWHARPIYESLRYLTDATRSDSRPEFAPSAVHRRTARRRGCPARSRRQRIAAHHPQGDRCSARACARARRHAYARRSVAAACGPGVPATATC